MTSESKIASECIAFDGFSIRIDIDTWPAKILRALLRRHYENNERQLLARFLKPQDRVIELGSALGVMALTAARYVPASQIFCYDANPEMVSQALGNFALNGTEISVENVVLLPECENPGPPITFYKTPYFLSSSLLRHRGDMQAVEVTTASLEAAIADHGANTLIIDVEGGEFELLNGADLNRIEKLSLELHLAHGDVRQCRDLISTLLKQGLKPDATLISENVFVFSKDPETAAAPEFIEAYLECLSATQKGNSSDTLRWLSDAVSAFGGNPYMWHLHAQLLAASGDVDAALAAAREATRLAPGNADIGERLADLLSRSGCVDEAAQAFVNAIAADKYRPLFHAGLGACLNRQGRESEALAAFEKAVSMVPPRAREFSALLSIASRQDKFVTNRRDEGLPTPAEGETHAVLTRLAEIVARRFRFTDAGAALGDAMGLAPEAHGLHCALAQLVATPRDIREAVSGEAL